MADRPWRNGIVGSCIGIRGIQRDAFRVSLRLAEALDIDGFEDRRFAYGEQRLITMGELRGVVVIIVTAETDEEIRVISMRKADRNEQEIYYDNL
ncbi:MAG: BrnT family toxin [Azoarcus sp.]|nr:BrnT family toxin [Azoarcus sp.]